MPCIFQKVFYLLHAKTASVDLTDSPDPATVFPELIYGTRYLCHIDVKRREPAKSAAEIICMLKWLIMPRWILERQRARAGIKYPWYLIWKSINANCTLLQRSSMTSAKCVWSPDVRFAFSLRYRYLIASALPRLVISVTRIRQYLNKLTQMHLSIPPPIINPCGAHLSS